jgi:hypothetical protein
LASDGIELIRARAGESADFEMEACDEKGLFSAEASDRSPAEDLGVKS